MEGGIIAIRKRAPLYGVEICVVIATIEARAATAAPLTGAVFAILGLAIAIIVTIIMCRRVTGALAKRKRRMS
jgi:NAD/NADP transhydrogenase beta subunit